MKFKVWASSIIVILMLGGCYPKYQQEMPSMRQVSRINKGLMKSIDDAYMSINSQQLVTFISKSQPQEIYFLSIYKTGEVRVYPEDTMGNLFKNGAIEGLKKNKLHLRNNLLLPIVFLIGKDGNKAPPINHKMLKKEIEKQLKKNQVKVVLPYLEIWLAYHIN